MCPLNALLRFFSDIFSTFFITPRLAAVVGSTTVSRSVRVNPSLSRQQCKQLQNACSHDPAAAHANTVHTSGRGSGSSSDNVSTTAAAAQAQLQQHLACSAELQVQQRFTFDSRLLCVLSEASVSPLQL